MGLFLILFLCSWEYFVRHHLIPISFAVLGTLEVLEAYDTYKSGNSPKLKLYTIIVFVIIFIIVGIWMDGGYNRTLLHMETLREGEFCIFNPKIPLWGDTMKRWSLILPILYFLLLFLLAVAFNFPREVTLQWTWIQIGGIVFMAALGIYIGGNASQKEVAAIGVFTLLWLAFVVEIRGDHFTLLGLTLELIMAMILRKAGRTA